MADASRDDPAAEIAKLKAENGRLNKTVQALMDRAERSAGAQALETGGSDFGRFQTAVMLEDQVRIRTAKLEAALAENEKVTRALRESEARFRELANQSLVGIAVTEDGRFTYTNAKFNEMFGYSETEIRKLGPLDVAVGADRPKVAESVRKRLSGETTQVVYGFRGLRKDGSSIDIEIHGGSMLLGEQKALVSVLLDVTERVRAEREMLALQQKLAEQSVHDALTGLYNRRHLEEVLGRELILAERQNYPVSMIMADIDHFKKVNDHYGHLAGDEVLRAFAALLKRSARASDIYCRYGGEEFLLVLPQMSGEKAAARAEELRRTVAAAPFRYGASAIPITASFGVAAFPANGEAGERVVDAADKALYEAKKSGRNRVRLSEVRVDA
jgi:diguanylate cyclase (GGDEF)-like protein/PAS domain S-box-containing protein